MIGDMPSPFTELGLLPVFRSYSTITMSLFGGKEGLPDLVWSGFIVFQETAYFARGQKPK
jgi:hypothetical protein